MRFVMLDRITEWEVGKAAKATKSLSLSEDFFADHFPKHPVMPGVLIIEAMAQLSGLLLQETCKRDYNKDIDAIMSMVENMKFKSMCKPGDVLHLESNISFINEDGGKVNVKTKVEDKTVAMGSIMFYFFPADNVSEETRKNYVRFLKEG